MKVAVPLRLGRGQNDRQSWRPRARKIRSERESVFWMLRTATKPAVPCVIVITRVAPSSGLDDDNLSGSCKAVRDEVAHWLGVDDKDSAAVKYRYAQRRGPWCVEIESQPCE